MDLYNTNEKLYNFKLQCFSSTKHLETCLLETCLRNAYAYI